MCQHESKLEKVVKSIILLFGGIITILTGLILPDVKIMGLIPAIPIIIFAIVTFAAGMFYIDQDSGMYHVDQD